MPMTASVFVYGTLKRGQCRVSLWPVEPLSIQIGSVRGALYSRADYPAMTVGDDCVIGELWRFDQDSIPAVLETLDQIEGTNQPGQKDLYSRIITEVMSVDGVSLGQAWSYRYASDPLDDGFVRIHAIAGGAISWP